MSANMIVGRVETYGRSGKVEDWMTFTDYEKFREHVLHDLSCGCPIGIIANKIPGIGVKTPTYWVMDEDCLPPPRPLPLPPTAMPSFMPTGPPPMSPAA